MCKFFISNSVNHILWLSFSIYIIHSCVQFVKYNICLSYFPKVLLFKYYYTLELIFFSISSSFFNSNKVNLQSFTVSVQSPHLGLYLFLHYLYNFISTLCQFRHLHHHHLILYIEIK